MKKRLLACLLSLALAIGLFPVSALATEDETPNDAVASIGETTYSTLAEAVKDASEQDTILLLKDAEGTGIGTFLTPSGNQASVKDFTIDFQGHTYTVTSGAVGSTGTTSQAFHLEWKGAGQDNANVTLKNGTITSAENSGVYMLIQNYCNLTLDNMTLDGSHLHGNGDYALSNNCGNVTVKDTKIITKENDVAFDVCDYASYPGVTVTVDGNSDIQGNLEVTNPNGGKNNASLVLKGGKFTVNTVKMDTNTTAPLSDYVPDNYVLTETDGAYTVAPLGADNAVAEIDGTYYKTLAAAITAAQSNDIVKLLKDISLTTQVSIPVSAVLTLDLNGKTLTVDNSNCALLNNGTLTIQDSVGGKIVSTKGSGMFVGDNSVTTIQSGMFESVEGAACTGRATGATITINGGTFKASDNAVIAGNGTGRSGDANTITINGGTFEGAIKTPGYVACGIYAPWKDSITVNGGTFNITDGAGIVARAGNVTVKGGIFNTTGNTEGYVGDSKTSVPSAALVFDLRANYPGLTAADKISVAGGQFKSDVAVIQTVGDNPTGRVSVESGYFTSDPSAYLAEGKASLTSDKAGYAFMVGDKATTNAEPATGAPTVDVSGIDDSDRETVKAVASGVTDSGELAAAANAVTAKVTDVQKAAAEATIRDENSGVTVGGSDTVTVYVQTYLDITPTTYKNEEEEKIFTLDITPMYRVVASTATAANEIKVVGETTGDETANAVVLEGSEQKLTDLKTMTISIPLPSGFVTDTNSKVYVQHKGYEYTATVTSSSTDTKTTTYTATFTNPHGFSEFTLSTTSSAVAKIGNTSYTSFQDAVNAAGNGETVEVVNDTNLSATISGSSKTIEVKNGTISDITVTINGTKKIISSGDTATFTYTKPSSGGGGGGSSVTTYTLTFDVNGGSAVAKVTGNKNAVIDLGKYTSTRDGYTFAGWYSDKNLTQKVTSVKLTGNTTVYAKWNEADKPAPTNPFIDVKAGDYFYDGVLWAVEKGITNGTSATTFSPNASCTRAQMVTFLWRANGSPAATGANPFTDVKSSDYYYDAVLWAVEKGITKGTSDTTFSPDQIVTRGQTVTFLYRTDGSPAVTGQNPFTDVAADAYYADAVTWAVANDITKGTSASTFSPNADCTRGQIVTFLYRDYAK